MSFTRWLRNLQSAWHLSSRSGNGRRVARSRPAPGYRPRLEALEDRCLMSAGALDTTFNPTGSPPGTVTTSMGGTYGSYADAVAIQPDGKIVAAGGINGQSGFGVARYNGNGSLDTGFNGTGTVTTQIGTRSYATELAIQSDGKIVVCGYAYSSGYLFAMARYTTTGTLDQSFGQHGIVTSTYGSSQMFCNTTTGAN
jgi:uncharacterized delta-60 repeat protein